MSAPEYHDAVFRWPHPEAHEVIVTGDFDGWSGSRHLNHIGDGFEGTAKVPWGSRVHYKFIVDGVWSIVDGQPTEYDHSGNLNNVFDSPARPPTPKDSEPPVPAPEPTVIEPTQLAGHDNGVLATIEEAAVAMVEAIAPGTTQTPVSETLAVDVSEPAPRVEEEIVEVVEVVETEAKDASTPEDVVEEITAEVVLPASTEEAPTAPVVPVPVLPLNTGDKAKQLETTIVEGSTTSQPGPVMEPSTHTPMDVPITNGSTEKTPEANVVKGSESSQPASGAEPSTHTPAPAPETLVLNGGTVEPSTHTPPVIPMNGKEGTKPEAVSLPPPTPAANGQTSSSLVESPTTTPQTSPRKEKKHAFPTFGRHSRRSSSSVSVSTHGGTDEHGVLDSPGSRNGSYKKKRTSSFFGRIKEIFTDHEHHHNGHK